MKIGILTYHRAHNYGAVLQAYALTTYLSSLGHDAELIDYWPEYREGEYDLFKYKFYLNPKLSILHRCKTLVFRSLTLAERLVRFNKFEKFINTEMRVAKMRCKTGADITTGLYDAIVCGSDQIWAYHKMIQKSGFDEVYYGKFPLEGSLKISYAASMGVEDLSGEVKKEFNQLVRNFDAVSVREVSLLKMIDSEVNAVQVIDPVFILPADKWREMTEKRKIQNKYLLFYQLLESAEARKLAEKVAKDKGLQIVEIRGAVTPFLWISGVECTTGPIDFISLIAHSDFVVSTSFHGVAFAIIFNKQFTAMGFGNNSSRVKSLLNTLGIPGNLKEDQTEAYEDEVDYKRLVQRLEEIVGDSTSFLKTHLPI